MGIAINRWTSRFYIRLRLTTSSLFLYYLLYLFESFPHNLCTSAICPSHGEGVHPAVVGGSGSQAEVIGSWPWLSSCFKNSLLKLAGNLTFNGRKSAQKRRQNSTPSEGKRKGSNCKVNPNPKSIPDRIITSWTHEYDNLPSCRITRIMPVVQS